MTKNELMQRVIDAYPDPDIIATYWNMKTQKMSKRGSGDTLAEFVVREVSETYDETGTDEEQLAMARHKIWLAQKDLVVTRSHLL